MSHTGKNYTDTHDNPLTWARDLILNTPRESGYPYQKHEFTNALGYTWAKIPHFDVPYDYQTPTQEANAIILYNRLKEYDPNQMWWNGSALKGEFELKLFSFPLNEADSLEVVDWQEFDAYKEKWLIEPNLSQIAEWFHEEFEPVQNGKWIELNDEVTNMLEEWNDLWHIENELGYKIRQRGLTLATALEEKSFPTIWANYEKDLPEIKQLQYYKEYPQWVYEVFWVIHDRDQDQTGDGGYYGNIDNGHIWQAAVDMDLIDPDQDGYVVENKLVRNDDGEWLSDAE